MITRLEIVILASWFGALMMLAYRLTIGVDLADESFYLVTAKSLIFWGQPFVKVLNLAQTSAILTLPFIRIWQSLFHMHNEGLIIWLRSLYLLLSLGTASLLYFYARSRVLRILALIVSFLPVAWIPFGLPSLSYNTIGENFFFIGLLLSCLSFQYPQFTPNPIIRALPFIVSCLAYPTFPVPCVAFLVLLIIFAGRKEDRRHALMALVVLIVSGLSIVLILALFSGTKEMMEAYFFCRTFVTAIQSHKLVILKEQISEHYFPVFTLIALLCTLGHSLWSSQIVRNISLLVFSIMLIVVSVLPSSMYVQSHAEVTLIAFFVLPQLFRFRQMPPSTYAAIAASYVAGLTTAFSSGNGFQSLCLGAFPAVCLGLCEILHQRGQLRHRLSYVISAFFAAVCCLVLLRSSFECIYGTDRDQDWHSLKRMPAGPFRFLRTRAEQKEKILALGSDLAPLSRHYGTVYIAGPPGFYLLSDLKPVDPTLWHISGPHFEKIKSSFQAFYARSGLPEVFVATDDAQFGLLNSLDREYLSRYYAPYVVRGDYAIYLLKDGHAVDSRGQAER